MRILVTGGAGFIGGNLCQVLTERADVDEVIALDNLSTGRAENLQGTTATLVESDLLDPDAVREAMRGCSSVVHLAALPSVTRSIENPLATHHANATGTVHVLEAARAERVEHLVVASSSSVYGASPALPKSEDLKASPLSPYAASKLAAESYALAHAHSFGAKVLALRFFNVFGPLQPAGHSYAAVVPTFVEAALAGRPLPLHGDGTQTRDFTFVGSVCAVLADAVGRHVHDPEPVNLAFGSRVTLLELISMLEEILGRPLEREHLPPRVGDVLHSQADQSRLRALFPTVEPLDLVAGLRQTIDWFRAKPVAPR